MTQAWQRREYEQQKFVEQLTGNILAEAEQHEDENFFLLKVAEGLLGDFYTADRRAEAHSPNALYRAANQWREKISAELLVFCRAEEEVDVLKFKILMRMIEMGLSGVRRAYLHLQVRAPKRLYAGHDSTDEI